MGDKVAYLSYYGNFPLLASGIMKCSKSLYLHWKYIRRVSLIRFGPHESHTNFSCVPQRGAHLWTSEISRNISWNINIFRNNYRFWKEILLSLESQCRQELSVNNGTINLLYVALLLLKTYSIKSFIVVKKIHQMLTATCQIHHFHCI